MPTTPLSAAKLNHTNRSENWDDINRIIVSIGIMTLEGRSWCFNDQYWWASQWEAIIVYKVGSARGLSYPPQKWLFRTKQQCRLVRDPLRIQKSAICYSQQIHLKWRSKHNKHKHVASVCLVYFARPGWVLVALKECSSASSWSSMKPDLPWTRGDRRDRDEEAAMSDNAVTSHLSTWENDSAEFWPTWNTLNPVCMWIWRGAGFWTLDQRGMVCSWDVKHRASLIQGELLWI